MSTKRRYATFVINYSSLLIFKQAFPSFITLRITYCVSIHFSDVYCIVEHYRLLDILRMESWHSLRPLLCFGICLVHNLYQLLYNEEVQCLWLCSSPAVSSYDYYYYMHTILKDNHTLLWLLIFT